MKMKRSLSILLVFVMVCTMLSTMASAATANFSFSGATKASMGKELSVTIQLTASEKLKDWKFSIKYDPAILEYKEGADNGGAGAVSFSGKAESTSGATSTLKKTIVFKTKKTGNVTLSVFDAEVIGLTSDEPLTLNSPTRKVSVVAASNLPEENSLVSLTVPEGKIKPDFDPETTEYTLTVPYEVTSLTVASKAKDEKATLVLSNADDLKVGENEVTLEVIAQNGSPRTYTITVTREKSELAGVTVDVGGTTYDVAYEANKLSVPSGYTAKTVTYQDKKMLAFVSPGETIQIVYLSSADDAAWYVYDEATGSFSEYLYATGSLTTVVVMTPSEEVKVPDGYEKTELTVGEKTWPVFKGINSEKDGVWLVYGMNSEGDRKFYFYDANLKTFSSYYEPIKDTKAEEQAAKEVKDMQELLKTAEKEAELMELLFIGASVLAVILLVNLVFFIVKGAPKQTAEKEAKPAKAKMKKEKSKKEKKIKKEENEENFDAVPEFKLPVTETVEKEENEVKAPEVENAPAAPATEAPKRRRARRSLDDIGQKEATPAPEISEVKEDLSAPELVAEETPAPVVEPQAKPEEKKSEPEKEKFSYDDLPTILR